MVFQEESGFKNEMVVLFRYVTWRHSVTMDINEFYLVKTAQNNAIVVLTILLHLSLVK